MEPYYSVMISWVPREFQTEWHPPTDIGPFRVLSRGGMFNRQTTDRVIQIQLVGYPSDVAVARHMFAWITVEISRLASHQSGRSARHAFCLGAVRGFATALAKSTKDAFTDHLRDHGTSAAMVLRDRAVEVDRYLNRTVGKLHAGAGPTFRDRSAYERGHAAGARLSVNHAPALSGGRRALPERT